VLLLGGVLGAPRAGALVVPSHHVAGPSSTPLHIAGSRPGRTSAPADPSCGQVQQATILLARWLFDLTGSARYRSPSADTTCVRTSLALRAATTPDPPPTAAPAVPAPTDSAPAPSAPATAQPGPTGTGATSATPAPGYGCAAALAYLNAHAAPGYQLVCPGYAQGHEGMTCDNWPSICPGQMEIVISDPCPVAYMNEASNSLVFSHLSTAPIDPYGYSCET